jgi:hypothetical protein
MEILGQFSPEIDTATRQSLGALSFLPRFFSDLDSSFI